MKSSRILTTDPGADYGLIDSGDCERLERFGKFVLSRPDPQALWRKRLGQEEWKRADAHFTRDDKGGDWVIKNGIENRWPISFGDLKLWIKPTAFKHVGVFPEQASNWDWLRERVSKNAFSNKPEVLNLFAYTGGATLACAQAGASIVHVDGSKMALTWARENAELSGLKDKPIRWILDDAATFVRREIKRSRKYQGIIMDPPAFGHGPGGELWKIEEDFLPLMESCFKLLADKPLFFLVNGYASGYSAIAYENNLKRLVNIFRGRIEGGELTIQESPLNNHETRLLPCGIFARWSI